MVAFGRQCDWYENIVAAPPLQAVVGRRTFVPEWRELSVGDASRLLADYEERRWWWGPLLPWLMTKLIGEPYTPGAGLQRRVVSERPMIAFRATT